MARTFESDRESTLPPSHLYLRWSYDADLTLKAILAGDQSDSDGGLLMGISGVDGCNHWHPNSNKPVTLKIQITVTREKKLKFRSKP